MTNHYVMDYETLSNCFVACFVHYTNSEIKTFVVHELRNDFNEFVEFLENNIKNKEWHISFNGLAFDSQITHYILENKDAIKKQQPETIARLLYSYAQRTINKQDRNEFSDYPSWKMSIKQIDLFKMNHWDNPAKSSSLKWIQYSMDWENVLEMPIHHSTNIDSLKQIDEIIKYCINDILSTKKIMTLCRDQIALRQTLTKEYGIDLYSASEPRISKELFTYFLVDKLKIDKQTLKQLRTKRKSIILKDCIIPDIKFDTETFNSVLNYFNSKVIVETKGSLNYSVKYKGVETFYGLGGIHGARKAGVYEAKYGYTIMTSDVN